MALHDSSVNFRNLIRDLADMYPFDVSEVVLVEVVANALDAKANLITVDFDPESRILTICDNGSGMNKDQFDKYHDFAASLKTRGDGIGFAGVGAKISFNVAERVITETRSSLFEGGSNWYLQPDGKLIWEDFDVKNLSGNGTRIQIHFGKNANVVYSSTEDLIKILQKHYMPVFENRFLHLYSMMGFYDENISFIVNGTPVPKMSISVDFGLSKEKEIIPQIKKQKKGYGIIGLAEKEYPLGNYISGVMICTHGKVIKTELFGQFPGEYGPKIFGVIEMPSLIDYLTANKTDFTRNRSEIRKFEELYESVREPFKEWLKTLGVYQAEEVAINETKALERELRKIIEDVPELSDFFGFKNRKNILSPSNNGSIEANPVQGEDSTFPVGKGGGTHEINPLVDVGDGEGKALEPSSEQAEIKADPISRVGNRGPKIQLIKRLDRSEVAWVEGNTIVINISHPGYIKISSNNVAKKLFFIVAVAGAIQKHISSPEDGSGINKDLTLLDRIVTAWGNK